MKLLRKNNHVIQVFAILVAGFIVAFGSVTLYMNIWVKPILIRQLKLAVYQATENLYQLEFSGMSVNVLTGDAHLNDVRFVADTAIYRKLTTLQRAPNNVYHLSLKKLSVRNVHPWRVFRNRKLNIDEVIINRPRVTMVNRQFAFNDDRPPRPVFSPYGMISKFLDEVSIDAIHFKDADFKYVDANGPVAVADSISHFNVTLKDWLVDPQSAEDTSRFHLLKDVVLQLDTFSRITADSLYHIQAKALRFSASTGRLDAGEISLTPRFGEMEFGKQKGNKRDRFTLQLKNIALKGIDLSAFLKKKELIAKDMVVHDGHLAVFYHPGIEREEVPGPALFPHQQLQQLTTRITIRQLLLRNLYIAYAEYNPSSREKGRITFEKTSGTIRHISNSPEEIKRHPIMEANLSTYLMGQGELKTLFRFDLQAKDAAFSYSGYLGGLNGTVLNSVTKPLAMMHIKSGKVQSLQFKIKANNQHARGNMAFRYNDLAIAVLKKEEGMSWFSRQGLLSFLANNLIVNADNPDHLGTFRPATIDFVRDPNSSFFSFLWKTLFQGIRHSVGVTPEKEARIKEHVARFERIKESRQKRKAARDRRREVYK